MSRPRIRTIKPEMWQSEAVGHLSLPARLLFIGLITMADDEGRLRALTPAVIGHVFPYDDVSPRKLRRWLTELVAARLIVEYVADETPYIALPTWLQHQKINRPTESRLPPPPGNITEVSVSKHGAITNGSSPHARTRVGADRIGSGKENPPIPPRGNRSRDRESYEEQLRAWASDLLPGAEPAQAYFAVKAALGTGGAKTRDDVLAGVRQWHPELLESAA